MNLEDDLQLRPLVSADAPLLVEATSTEPGRALWGPHPVGPYALHNAEAALADWDPSGGGQFSLGILQDQQLLGAVGVIPDNSQGIELAYWVRPEARGRGIASRAVQAVTQWTHTELGVARVWLEIKPGNEPSLRLAQRIGYHFEQHIPHHCREWRSELPEHDTWHDCLIWVHASPLREDLQQA